MNGRFENGDKHPLWKGNQCGYSAAHEWLNIHFPRKGVCLHCREEKKTGYAFKGPNGQHTRNIKDYIELCEYCHRVFDSQKDLK